MDVDPPLSDDAARGYDSSQSSGDESRYINRIINEMTDGTPFIASHIDFGYLSGDYTYSVGSAGPGYYNMDYFNMRSSSSKKAQPHETEEDPCIKKIPKIRDAMGRKMDVIKTSSFCGDLDPNYEYLRSGSQGAGYYRRPSPAEEDPCIKKIPKIRAAMGRKTKIIKSSFCGDIDPNYEYLPSGSEGAGYYRRQPKPRPTTPPPPPQPKPRPTTPPPAPQPDANELDINSMREDCRKIFVGPINEYKHAKNKLEKAIDDGKSKKVVNLLATKSFQFLSSMKHKAAESGEPSARPPCLANPDWYKKNRQWFLNELKEINNMIAKYNLGKSSANQIPLVENESPPLLYKLGGKRTKRARHSKHNNKTRKGK